jgi:hypothetical protein
MASKSVKIKLTLIEFNEEIAEITNTEFMNMLSESFFSLEKREDKGVVLYYLHSNVEKIINVGDSFARKINEITHLNCSRAASGYSFGTLSVEFLDASNNKPYSLPDNATIDGSEVGIQFSNNY